MTNHVYYMRRVSGKGTDAVYNLYVDDKLRKSSILLSEVVEIFNKDFDEAKTKNKRSFLSRLIDKIKKHGN